MRPAVVTALIIATALFMENMDGTVLSTSLPAIAADLHRDPIVLKLALTSYMLTLAVFIPASGWVADKIGARTVFCTAIVTFTLGSILCGASSTLGELIAARVFQGLGGAMMVPVGRLVLLRSVPKSEMVNSLAYLTLPALLGPVMGPPLGGFITTYFHWRWIFWINVPIGLLGVILTLRFIANLRERDVAPFDVKGFLLSGPGLLGLVSGLSVIGRGVAPWSVVFALIAGGFVLLALYVRHARRAPDPIIDLNLLKLPTFFSGVAGGFLFRLGIGSIPFLLPLLLQVGFGLSPFESGSLTFAAAAGAMAMKVTATRLIKRFGFRTILVGNAFICAAFLASYGLIGANTPHVVIFLALLIGGFFRSLQFTALNAIGYADVSKARMSRATSFASVSQQMSQAVGVAVAAAAVQGLQWAFGDATLAPRDMQMSFFVVAGVSLCSVLIFARLKPDAGAEVSGHALPASPVRAVGQPAE
jgi:EmrB/QacA subfamily drug resistance transporter